MSKNQNIKICKSVLAISGITNNTSQAGLLKKSRRILLDLEGSIV